MAGRIDLGRCSYAMSIKIASRIIHLSGRLRILLTTQPNGSAGYRIHTGYYVVGIRNTGVGSTFVSYMPPLEGNTPANDSLHFALSYAYTRFTRAPGFPTYARRRRSGCLQTTPTRPPPSRRLPCQFSTSTWRACIGSKTYISTKHRWMRLRARRTKRVASSLVSVRGTDVPRTVASAAIYRRAALVSARNLGRNGGFRSDRRGITRTWACPFTGIKMSVCWSRAEESSVRLFRR